MEEASVSGPPLEVAPGEIVNILLLERRNDPFELCSCAALGVLEADVPLPATQHHRCEKRNAVRKDARKRSCSPSARDALQHQDRIPP